MTCCDHRSKVASPMYTREDILWMSFMRLLSFVPVFYLPSGKSNYHEYATISETTAKLYHPGLQDAGHAISLAPLSCYQQ